MTDPARVRQTQAPFIGSVRVQSTIEPEWAKARGFVVVPVPGQELSAIPLDPLARAIREIGVNEVVAVHSGRPVTPRESEFIEHVRTESPPAAEIPSVFLLSPSAEDIFDVVYKEHASFEYFLTDPDIRFAILLTHDETSLVSGPREFVESVLGKSLDEAWRDFEAYVEEMKPYGVDLALAKLVDLYRPLSFA